jgi:5-methylcytosine-specific restriction endonuclease McrA
VIAQAQKRQFAATETPRPVADEPCGEPTDRDGAIPAHVRREVAARDGYRCTFVADDGTRCGATAWLEFDHIVPRKLGGPSTVSNVRLLCKLCRIRHNLHYADSRIMPTWVGSPRKHCAEAGVR